MSTGNPSPPPAASTVLQLSSKPISDLIALSAKEKIRLEGGGSAEAAKIDSSLEKTKETVANSFDLIFSPAPIFTEAITDPEVMARLVSEIPEVADNAVSLFPEILRDSAVGKAIQAVKMSKENIPYYSTFGRMTVDSTYLIAYNRNVERSMTLLLSRASREEVQNLMRILTVPQMQAFRTGLFDLFLLAPRDAMRALQTIVGQILPHNLLTPAAFDLINTTLQQNPDNLSAVLERIVRERASAEQEVSFATRLWRYRAAGQTTGRYGILGLGVGAVLFLAALYGFSNPYELIFILRNELASFGLSDMLAEGINRLDHFYDALHFAVIGRNAEQAISTGVVAPASATIQAVRNWWSGFIQAGHPRTIVEVVVDNLNTILDRVGRQNAALFAGASVIGIMVYRGRQLAIQEERTQLAAVVVPEPPAAPRDNRPENVNANGGNNNSPVPNLPPRASLPRENFGIASLRRSNQNMAAIAAALPGNRNNW